MIRSNAHLNNENLISRMESYNNGYLNRNMQGILDLYGEVAKNINSINESIGNYHDRQTISLFAKNIKTDFPLLAGEINTYINVYYFKVSEIAENIIPHLSQHTSLCKSDPVDNLKYVAPFSTGPLKQYTFELKTASEIITWAKKHQFTTLDLTGFQFTETEYLELAKYCRHLTSITFPENVTENGIIAFAKNCRNLNEFKYESYKFTDAILKEIGKNCPLLTKINLKEAEVSDEGIIALAKGCPHLMKIDASDTDVTEKGLVELTRHCRHLVEVSCHDIELSDGGLTEFINNCTYLTKLDLRHAYIENDLLIELLKDRSNLKTLKLTGSISEEHFAIILKSFRNLEELSIDEYPISYDELRSLARNNPELSFIFDTDDISDEDYEQFQDDFPNCNSLA